MIHIHEHPICEYDEARDAIIQAGDFLEKYLPEKCVITFFRKELEQFPDFFVNIISWFFRKIKSFANFCSILRATK